MIHTENSEQFLLLDDIIGWQVDKTSGLTLAQPERRFELEPLPGTAKALLEERTEKEFLCPSALAPETCDRVLVVDAALHLVKRIHLRSPDDSEAVGPTTQQPSLVQSVETLPAIGGKGSQPRQLREPRGIAVLPSGAIVVADTGNHRLQIFSPLPYALLQVWSASDLVGQPTTGQGRKEFHWPWAVAADQCGIVYIADRGNHRIQVVSRDGEWLDKFGGHSLTAPIRLALGPDRYVAVVDLRPQNQTALLVFSGDGLQQTLPLASNPQSVAFDPSGRLYVGDDIGLVHVFRRDARSGEYHKIGEGVSGLDGAVVDLAWASPGRLLAIIRNETGEVRQRLWLLDQRGGFATEGSFATRPLDSGIERGQWHRIALKATVPEGTSILIETRTSEDENSKSADWKQCTLSGDDDPDCLVQSGPGRFLWLRLTFRSNGRRSPSLHSIKIHFPRASYLQYLPAVYQEDRESRAFLERFLSIFQTEFDDLDQRLDVLWQLFDPTSDPGSLFRRAASAPESVTKTHLRWLAGWLALTINPDWSEVKLRTMIKKASIAYRIRGTRQGMEQAIMDYAGAPHVKVIEHYRLRRWTWLSSVTPEAPEKSIKTPLDGTARLWSRDFYQRLQLDAYSQLGYFRLTGVPDPILEPLQWGAHKFTVFFPAHPYLVEETRRQVAIVVEREKPAHTEAELCPVFPRLRVGVQATIGVDTSVGGFTKLVLNRLATLNYDAILGCSPAEQQMRRRQLSPRPHIGRTTRIE